MRVPSKKIPDTFKEEILKEYRKQPKLPRSRKYHHLSEGESDNEDPNILYRSLRADENPISQGLQPPKNHDPSISASKHISKGSTLNIKSSWVSLTRSLKVAAAWASQSNNKIAKVSISGEDRSAVIDMTEPKDAKKVFPTGQGSSLNTAKASQEVIIKGGVKRTNIIAIYGAEKISVEQYKSIKKEIEEGKKPTYNGKPIYSVVRTRAKSKGQPLPRVIFEEWTASERKLSLAISDAEYSKSDITPRLKKK